MRRKLAYSIHSPVPDKRIDIGSLPQGDWHVSKTGGILFVGDTNWKSYVILGEAMNEAEFHLDKTLDMLLQIQDGTTCRDIAIESKPAYDIYVVGGGASELLHRADRTVLAPSRLVVGRENRESMAGPALRKQGRHLERDTEIYHHSEERRPLGIHHTQWRILHPEAEVRMHDDAAQPAQLMGLHTSGAGGYAAHGEWGLRHGHHQRRSKEYCWHQGDCRYQDHGDGRVRRRSGRMGDTAGGGSARLRSRHRPLLAPSLGVAA